ncbi:penicillin-binding protein 2 [bacterium]|nr:MAG: penicillin-binding protein 2 [bacterium]
MKLKLLFLKTFFIVFTFLILAFLFRWQIIDHNYFSKLAEQRFVEYVTSGERGKIIAHDGTVLVYNENVWDVYVYKPELEIAEKIQKVKVNNESFEVQKQTRKEFVEKVAAILNVFPQEIEEKINSDGNYIKIASQIDLSTKNALEFLPGNSQSGYYLKGINFEETFKRGYPNGTLASNILGYLGYSDKQSLVGTHGIEQAWNGDLSPQSGYQKIEIDIDGNPIIAGESETLNYKNGSDIKLSIDPTIQSILEKKLKEGKEKYQAENAIGIIMEPKTGDIKGMAVYPSYDPAKYSEVTDLKQLNNLAVSESYEPGSIGKVFTTAVAYDLGVADEDTVVVESHPGCININEWKICNALKVPAKNLTVKTTLMTSDNIGAYGIAKLVGEENLKNYLRKFGLAQSLNVGLAEEQTEFYNFDRKWPEVELATSSFGQSYTLTALQIVDAYAAIANDGLRMKPKIVSEVVSEEGVKVIENKLIETVISPEASQKTNATLTKVFADNLKNTATRAQYDILSKYSLAGKSGTAQIPKKDGTGYEDNAVNSTYIGYDTSSEKSFVMLIKLTKPKIGRFANNNVMPLWYDTFIELKDLL